MENQNQEKCDHIDGKNECCCDLHAEIIINRSSEIIIEKSRRHCNCEISEIQKNESSYKAYTKKCKNIEDSTFETIINKEDSYKSEHIYPPNCSEFEEHRCDLVAETNGADENKIDVYKVINRELKDRIKDVTEETVNPVTKNSSEVNVLNVAKEDTLKLNGKSKSRSLDDKKLKIYLENDENTDLKIQKPITSKETAIGKNKPSAIEKNIKIKENLEVVEANAKDDSNNNEEQTYKRRRVRDTINRLNKLSESNQENTQYEHKFKRKNPPEIKFKSDLPAWSYLNSEHENVFQIDVATENALNNKTNIDREKNIHALENVALDDHGKEKSIEETNLECQTASHGKNIEPITDQPQEVFCETPNSAQQNKSNNKKKKSSKEKKRKTSKKEILISEEEKHSEDLSDRMETEDEIINRCDELEKPSTDSTEIKTTSTELTLESDIPPKNMVKSLILMMEKRQREMSEERNRSRESSLEPKERTRKNTRDSSRDKNDDMSDTKLQKGRQNESSKANIAKQTNALDNKGTDPDNIQSCFDMDKNDDGGDEEYKIDDTTQNDLLNSEKKIIKSEGFEANEGDQKQKSSSQNSMSNDERGENVDVNEGNKKTKDSTMVTQAVDIIQEDNNEDKPFDDSGISTQSNIPNEIVPDQRILEGKVATQRTRDEKPLKPNDYVEYIIEICKDPLNLNSTPNNVFDAAFQKNNERAELIQDVELKKSLEELGDVTILDGDTDQIVVDEEPQSFSEETGNDENIHQNEDSNSTEIIKDKHSSYSEKFASEKTTITSMIKCEKENLKNEYSESIQEFSMKSPLNKQEINKVEKQYEKKMKIETFDQEDTEKKSIDSNGESENVENSTEMQKSEKKDTLEKIKIEKKIERSTDGTEMIEKCLYQSYEIKSGNIISSDTDLSKEDQTVTVIPTIHEDLRVPENILGDQTCETCDIKKLGKENLDNDSQQFNDSSEDSNQVLKVTIENEKGESHVDSSSQGNEKYSSKTNKEELEDTVVIESNELSAPREVDQSILNTKIESKPRMSQIDSAVISDKVGKPISTDHATSEVKIGLDLDSDLTVKDTEHCIDTPIDWKLDESINKVKELDQKEELLDSKSNVSSPEKITNHELLENLHTSQTDQNEKSLNSDDQDICRVEDDTTLILVKEKGIRIFEADDIIAKETLPVSHEDIETLDSKSKVTDRKCSFKSKDTIANRSLETPGEVLTVNENESSKNIKTIWMKENIEDKSDGIEINTTEMKKDTKENLDDVQEFRDHVSSKSIPLEDKKNLSTDEEKNNIGMETKEDHLKYEERKRKIQDDNEISSEVKEVPLKDKEMSVQNDEIENDSSQANEKNEEEGSNLLEDKDITPKIAEYNVSSDVKDVPPRNNNTKSVLPVVRGVDDIQGNNIFSSDITLQSETKEILQQKNKEEISNIANGTDFSEQTQSSKESEANKDFDTKEEFKGDESKAGGIVLDGAKKDIDIRMVEISEPAPFLKHDESFNKDKEVNHTTIEDQELKSNETINDRDPFINVKAEFLGDDNNESVDQKISKSETIDLITEKSNMEINATENIEPSSLSKPDEHDVKFDKRVNLIENSRTDDNKDPITSDIEIHNIKSESIQNLKNERENEKLDHQKTALIDNKIFIKNDIEDYENQASNVSLSRPTSLKIKRSTTSSFEGNPVAIEEIDELSGNKTEIEKNIFIEDQILNGASKEEDKKLEDDKKKKEEENEREIHSVKSKLSIRSTEDEEIKYPSPAGHSSPMSLVNPLNELSRGGICESEAPVKKSSNSQVSHEEKPISETIPTINIPNPEMNIEDKYINSYVGIESNNNISLQNTYIAINEFINRERLYDVHEGDTTEHLSNSKLNNDNHSESPKEEEKSVSNVDGINKSRVKNASNNLKTSDGEVDADECESETRNKNNKGVTTLVKNVEIITHSISENCESNKYDEHEMIPSETPKISSPKKVSIKNEKNSKDEFKGNENRSETTNVNNFKNESNLVKNIEVLTHSSTKHEEVSNPCSDTDSSEIKNSSHSKQFSIQSGKNSDDEFEGNEYEPEKDYSNFKEVSNIVKNVEIIGHSLPDHDGRSKDIEKEKNHKETKTGSQSKQVSLNYAKNSDDEFEGNEYETETTDHSNLKEVSNIVKTVEIISQSLTNHDGKNNDQGKEKSFKETKQNSINYEKNSDDEFEGNEYETEIEDHSNFKEVSNAMKNVEVITHSLTNNDGRTKDDGQENNFEGTKAISHSKPVSNPIVQDAVTNTEQDNDLTQNAKDSNVKSLNQKNINEELDSPKKEATNISTFKVFDGDNNKEEIFHSMSEQITETRTENCSIKPIEEKEDNTINQTDLKENSIHKETQEENKDSNIKLNASHLPNESKEHRLKRSNSDGIDGDNEVYDKSSHHVKFIQNPVEKPPTNILDVQSVENSKESISIEKSCDEENDEIKVDISHTFEGSPSQNIHVVTQDEDCPNISVQIKISYNTPEERGSLDQKFTLKDNESTVDPESQIEENKLESKLNDQRKNDDLPVPKSEITCVKKSTYTCIEENFENDPIEMRKNVLKKKTNIINDQNLLRNKDSKVTEVIKKIESFDSYEDPKSDYNLGKLTLKKHTMREIKSFEYQEIFDDSKENLHRFQKRRSGRKNYSKKAMKHTGNDNSSEDSKQTDSDNSSVEHEMIISEPPSKENKDGAAWRLQGVPMEINVYSSKSRSIFPRSNYYDTADNYTRRLAEEKMNNESYQMNLNNYQDINIKNKNKPIQKIKNKTRSCCDKVVIDQEEKKTCPHCSYVEDNRPLFVTTVKKGMFLEPPPEIAAMLGLTSKENAPDSKRNMVYSFSSKPRPCQHKREISKSELNSGNESTRRDHRKSRGPSTSSHQHAPQHNPDIIGMEAQGFRFTEAKRRTMTRNRVQASQYRHLRTHIDSPPALTGRKHEIVQTLQTGDILEEITDNPSTRSLSIQTDPSFDSIPSTSTSRKAGTTSDCEVQTDDVFDYTYDVQPVLDVILSSAYRDALMEVLHEDDQMLAERKERIFKESRNQNDDRDHLDRS